MSRSIKNTLLYLRELLKSDSSTEQISEYIVQNRKAITFILDKCIGKNLIKDYFCTCCKQKISDADEHFCSEECKVNKRAEMVKILKKENDEELDYTPRPGPYEELLDSDELDSDELDLYNPELIHLFDIGYFQLLEKCVSGSFVDEKTFSIENDTENMWIRLFSLDEIIPKAWIVAREKYGISIIPCEPGPVFYAEYH